MAMAFVLATLMVAPGKGQMPQPAGLSAQTASFGPLLPGKMGTPTAVRLAFQLAIPGTAAVKGYRVHAVSSFTFTPSVQNDGGRDVTAKDVGVEIESVTSTMGGTVSTAATMFGGKATLANFLTSPEIARIPGSAGRVPATGVTLTLNLKIAVPSQYFTPGGISGTVTLFVVE